MNKEQPNAIFISDCHLCHPYSNAELLYDFLDKYKPKKLFIIGDFIDSDHVKKWKNINNNILRKLFKWSFDGTEIIYVLGNHDNFLDNWEGYSFGNIYICEEYIYTSSDNNKYLIIHGDQFDVYIGPFIYFVGSIGYCLALYINNILRNIGLTKISISKMLKQKVKYVIAHINKFEKSISEYAIKRQCNKVISGHIHHPVQKYITNNIEYFNCGDWIENNTAIIENIEGKLEIIKFEKDTQ
jgi:UDP-2,3-diacylglucosamine pyrophosphatase LpxH